MIDLIVPVLILGAILLGLTAALAAVRRFRDQKRKDALIQKAHTNDLTYLEADPDIQDEPFMSFHLFHLGYSRDFTNVMRGKVKGMTAAFFDYKYTISEGRTTSTTRQTVACYKLEEASVPTFELHPEIVGKKIASLFGYQDIRFDAPSEFSKYFLLRSPDETASRPYFTEKMRGEFKKDSEWSVEGGGQWVIVYRPGQRITPENFKSFIRDTRRTAGIFATKNL